MSYHIKFGEHFAKSAKKLDKPVAKEILNWIEKELSNCNDPYQYGKALKHQLKGYWRYKRDNYRILAKVDESHNIIYILYVGHRKNFYAKVKRQTE